MKKHERGKSTFWIILFFLSGSLLLVSCGRKEKEVSVQRETHVTVSQEEDTEQMEVGGKSETERAKENEDAVQGAKEEQESDQKSTEQHSSDIPPAELETDRQVERSTESKQQMDSQEADTVIEEGTQQSETEENSVKKKKKKKKKKKEKSANQDASASSGNERETEIIVTPEGNIITIEAEDDSQQKPGSTNTPEEKSSEPDSSQPDTSGSNQTSDGALELPFIPAQ